MDTTLLTKHESNTSLTNREILNLCTRLENLRDVPTFSLNKAISKTLKSLVPIKKAYEFDKFVKKTSDYSEYEKVLNESYRKLATPEGSNMPKTKVNLTEKGESTFLDLDFNSLEVSIVRNELDNKYAIALRLREEQIIAYAKWLDEPCTDNYELHYITEEDMPKDNGNYKELWDVLLPLIK